MPRSYAAERWAHAVATVLTSSEDLRTVPNWARKHGVSPGTLREWCRLAGPSAKASLDFARMLRVVLVSQHNVWEPQNALNIAERRTLGRLLAASGLTAHSQSGPNTLQFLTDQRFVSDRACLDAVNELLNEKKDAVGLQAHESSRPVRA